MYVCMCVCMCGCVYVRDIHSAYLCLHCVDACVCVCVEEGECININTSGTALTPETKWMGD